MLFSSSSDTEDLIVENLLAGESTAKQLHQKIIEESTVSLQAIYNALGKLIEAEVVTKAGKRVSISKEWLQKFNRSISTGSTLPPLKEGESITYSFHSFSRQDVFWKHLVLSAQEVNPNFPIFFYDPHEMFVYLRPDSQKEYLFNFEKSKRHAFMTIGGKTKLDHVYLSQWTSQYFQIDLNPSFSDKRNVHLSIIGDYLVETIISLDAAEEVDKLYLSTTDELELATGLTKLFNKKTLIKVRLSKKGARARKLRYKLSKRFFIPREVQERLSTTSNRNTLR